eukprot:CAMPEP_0168422804 /NCGR_PEP_ID=MMETSP0228-20121227/33983_1 /TAXON_ID=133427 /ORGANISM="Protoceratium reticulatum, Strain CCCM 535 (=CCMP 1889)" /LENGTH=56 /DNA_ID=CAMNT_0008436749 /DNA_START=50 /DNA_END=216 /DNA_ORIENTATION=-
MAGAIPFSAPHIAAARALCLLALAAGAAAGEPANSVAGVPAGTTDDLLEAVAGAIG